MSWALLEKMLADVATHSTLIGKYWFSFLFVFRVIVVLSVGDKVYGDEQSRFICNTLQPGCENVCFNRFSPISHIRFWAMQILLVSLPSVIFIVWAMHSLNKAQLKKEKQEKEMKQAEIGTDPMAKDPAVGRESVRNRYSDQPPKYNGDTERKSVSDKDPKRKKKNNRSDRHHHHHPHNNAAMVPVAEIVPIRALNKKKIKDPPILAGYVLQVFFRMGIEITFIVTQYLLFQTRVPEMYRCERYPCPQVVECFVSRPMEKTIFMLFMYAIAGACVALDLLELKYLGIQKIRHCLSGKEKGYLHEFEGRWHNDEILGGRFDIVGRNRGGLRRHRDMSITDPESGGAYDSIETSDDGSGFE